VSLPPLPRLGRLAAPPRRPDPRSPALQLGRQLNLPPSYLLIHRVTLSTIGVLCQLGATVRLREELEDWLPGFVEEDGAEDGAFGVASESAGAPGTRAASVVPEQAGDGDAVSDGRGVRGAGPESGGEGYDQGGDGWGRSAGADADAAKDRDAGSAEEDGTVPPGEGASGSEAEEAEEEGKGNARGREAGESCARGTTVHTDTVATNAGPNSAG
ncbi:hypothetical protein AB8B12_30240, partial [Streptomyces sp. PGLac3x]